MPPALGGPQMIHRNPSTKNKLMTLTVIHCPSIKKGYQIIYWGRIFNLVFYLRSPVIPELIRVSAMPQQRTQTCG